MSKTSLLARWDAIGLDRRIASVLLGGVAMLVCELRFEHREALGETWRSWIPIVYGIATFLVGSAALLRWERGGRKVLAVLFGAGLLVGLLGFWFHTGGHPFNGVRDVVSTWLVTPGKDGGIKMGSRPPALAPLALCGLGTLGLLACTSRRTPRSL